MSDFAIFMKMINIIDELKAGRFLQNKINIQFAKNTWPPEMLWIIGDVHRCVIV